MTRAEQPPLFRLPRKTSQDWLREAHQMAVSAKPKTLTPQQEADNWTQEEKIPAMVNRFGEVVHDIRIKLKVPHPLKFPCPPLPDKETENYLARKMGKTHQRAQKADYSEQCRFNPRRRETLKEQRKRYAQALKDGHVASPTEKRIITQQVTAPLKQIIWETSGTNAILKGGLKNVVAQMVIANEPVRQIVAQTKEFKDERRGLVSSYEYGKRLRKNKREKEKAKREAKKPVSHSAQPILF